jgi:hypothetical protein
MINVNTDVAIKLIVVLWVLNGITRIICGISGSERPTKYGKADMLDGFITILFAILVLLV